MQKSQEDVMWLVAIMVTSTVFKKSSLEIIFLKKWSLLLLIIGRIIQTW